MEIQRATKKNKTKKQNKSNNFAGVSKLRHRKLSPQVLKTHTSAGCETVTQLAKQLNFGDRLNIIFVISVGIFRREPFYFFRQIQDKKRYFKV